MAITIVYLDSEDMEKLNHGEKVVINMNSRIQNSNELWIRTNQDVKKKHFILVGATRVRENNKLLYERRCLYV